MANLTDKQIRTKALQLQTAGASQDKIREFVRLAKQEQNDKPIGRSFLGKAAKISDIVIGKPAELLFGTSAGAIGSIIGQGVESAFELFGRPTQRKFTKEADKRFGTPGKLVKTSVFTALELLPASQLTKVLKIPGVKQLVSSIQKGGGKVAKGLKAGAVKKIESVLAPTTKEAKRITQKISQKLAEKKIIAITRQSLLNKAEKTLTRIGDKFDEVLNKIPQTKTIDSKPVIDALESAKSDFRLKSGNKIIEVEPEAIRRIEQVQDIINKFGNKVEFKTLRSLRQIWDKVVAKSKGFTKTVAEGTELDIKKRAANSIRNELSKASPDLAKVNAEFSFWEDVSYVLGSTIERKTGQVGALQKVVTTIGGGAGFAGGGISGAATGAVATNFLTRIFMSTAYRTISASLKTSLANAILTGNEKNIIEVSRRILTAIENARN